jgi:hypothetical protein
MASGSRGDARLITVSILVTEVNSSQEESLNEGATAGARPSLHFPVPRRNTKFFVLLGPCGACRRALRGRHTSQVLGFRATRAGFEGGAILPGVDFAFEHWFEAPPEAVAGALLDLDYQRSLSEIDVLSDREVLNQEEADDGRVVRRVRCVLGVDLGGAKRFIGDSEPAWVEEARWDPATRKWEWLIHPEVAKELLSASGYIEIDGSEEESVRIVSGNVKVKVPLYGGKVEAAIVRGLETAYAQEAEKLAEWLDQSD